jgi:disulfide bond formation protein DsbB
LIVPSSRIINLLGIIVCILLLAVAYILEYAYSMEPCMLCVIQRLVLILLAAIFLVAWIHNPQRLGIRGYASFSLLLALLGSFLAARQIWIQTHPTQAYEVCLPSFVAVIKMLPPGQIVRVLLEGSDSCRQVYRLFGLGIPVWTLASFLFFTLISLYQLLWPKPAKSLHR